MYPRAIPDVRTGNETFVQITALYKAMGIKNHAWPLFLMQPELSGVDPHDEKNLDDLTRSKIILETKYNLWYYLREVARIPQDGTPVPTKYLANRANMALSWAFMCNIDIVIIMPRQCGKSVGTDTIMLWIMDIAGENTNIQLLTKDIKLRIKNIKRIKLQRSKLPSYMVSITNKDADNTEVITNVTLNNTYTTAVGRSDKDAAENVGRGLTSAILQADEPPYTPNIHIALPIALASGTKAREIAKQNGTFYCNIFTTTAGKLDTLEGAYCYEMYSAGAWWNEKYLDAENRNHLANMMKKNMSGERLLFNGTFSHLQIGKSNEWLKDAMVNAGGSKESLERDFMNVWSSGGVSSPLPVDVLNAIRLAGNPAKYIETTSDDYMVKWHFPEREIANILSNEFVSIGLDTSNASGSDANGVVFTRLRDMKVIGVAEINEANNQAFALWIAGLLITFKNIVLIFENKSSGMTICDIIVTQLIIFGINPFLRIFNRVIDEIDDPKYDKDREAIKNSEGIDMRMYIKYKRLFGFMTTGPTRSMLYGTVFRRACFSAGHMISDETLSKQLRELVEINQRIDHVPGGHDDTVIAWLLTHWFATHANNLYIYGIPKGLVYAQVVENSTTKPKNDLELKEDERNNALKQKIVLLKDRMIMSTSNIEKQGINLQINNLLKQVVDVVVRTNIIDSLREQVREKTETRPTLRDALDRLAA